MLLAAEIQQTNSIIKASVLFFKNKMNIAVI